MTTYYHATWVEFLPSIIEHGLDPAFCGKHFNCTAGVYLASSPELAFMMLLDGYLTAGDTGSKPSERLEAMRIVEIGVDKLDGALIFQDPHFGNPSLPSWMYGGRIDISGCEVLTVDQAMGGLTTHGL